MNLVENERLVAAARTVVVNAAAERTQELPDIERAVDSLRVITTHRPQISDCPPRIHDLLDEVPEPAQTDLAGLLIALREAAATLSWTDPYEHRDDQADLRSGYFVTAIAAKPNRETALSHNDIASVFLTVQAPHTLYPAHSHLAPELYCAVAGAAEWQKAKEPFISRPAGSWIVHSPWTSHAMQTREEPLVALAIWTADLDSLPTLDD